MRGVWFVPAEEATAPPRPPTGHSVEGRAERRLVSPASFPLWLLRGHMAPGAALVWSGEAGDESVYVLEGALDVDGRRCPAGGALVIEAGASARAVAVGPTGAVVVHNGRWEPAPARRPTDPVDPVDPVDPAAPVGGEVHVVGPGGTWAREEPGRTSRFFADSTCPTCALTLLYTARAQPYRSAPHSHSADELIHVLHGELRIGATTVGPGGTVAVAADRRYGFRSDGFAFLNYRSGPSSQTIDRQAPPVPEGGEVHGFHPVMDLR